MKQLGDHAAAAKYCFDIPANAGTWFASYLILLVPFVLASLIRFCLLLPHAAANEDPDVTSQQPRPRYQSEERDLDDDEKKESELSKRAAWEEERSNAFIALLKFYFVEPNLVSE